MPLLALSSKLLNFITFLLFLNLFTGSKLMREFNTKCSFTYNTFLFGQLSYLHYLLSPKRNCSMRSSSLVTLSRPSNHYRLKITNRSSHLNAPVLWNRLPPDLRHFSSHSMSSQPNLNSPVFSFTLSF
jgi:hypothetical protein